MLSGGRVLYRHDRVVLAIPTPVTPAFPGPATPELYCRGDEEGPNLLPQDRKALDEAVKTKFPTVSYACRTQERCVKANESHYLDMLGCIKARVRLDRSDVTNRMAKNLHNNRNNRSQGHHIPFYELGCILKKTKQRLVCCIC